MVRAYTHDDTSPLQPPPLLHAQDSLEEGPSLHTAEAILEFQGLREGDRGGVGLRMEEEKAREAVLLRDRVEETPGICAASTVRTTLCEMSEVRAIYRTKRV